MSDLLGLDLKSLAGRFPPMLLRVGSDSLEVKVLGRLMAGDVKGSSSGTFAMKIDSRADAEPRSSELDCSTPLLLALDLGGVTGPMMQSVSILINSKNAELEMDI